MRKAQSVLSVVILTATAFIASLPAAGADIAPHTPDNDNSADLATPITSGVTAAGDVARADDRYDFYKITALAGQTIKAVVNFSTSAADLRLDVYDPGGASVLPQQEVYGGGTIRGDTALAPINGTYYIRINCNANNQASYYNLTVTVADPPVLVPDVLVNGTISSPESRTDWYRVWLNGSTGGNAEGFWVNMTYRSNSGAYINKYFVDLLNYNGTHTYNSSSWFTTRTNVSGLASYTGWYYYRINFGSWNGGTGTSNYSLMNGRFMMNADSDNDFRNATAAPKNAHITGAVDKAFDHYDWYSYGVVTNDNIIVNVSRTSSAAYFNCTVYNSRMERVISDESTGGGMNPTRWINQTVPSAPADDTYYIAVILVGISSFGGVGDDPATMNYWINFSSPNHPPQIKSQFSPITINEDERHELNVHDYFTDPDGDSIKVKVTAPHVQGSYCQTTGMLQLFGAPNWYGNENAQVIAQDSQFQTAAIVNVTVLSVEDAPYLMKPIADVNMDQAKSFGPFDLNAFFFDNDTLYAPGDKLSFGVFANSSIWVNITSAGKVTLTAPVNFWGVVNMTFSATDLAGNIASGVCKVTVRHVNQPPLVKNEPPELLVDEDGSLVFDFSSVFWDPDGDPVTLTATQNMNIEVFTAPGDLNVTFRPKPDMSGFYENILLTAKDSSGTGSNYVVAKVTVVPVNDPPRITAFSPPGNVTLTEGEALDFSVAALDQESASAVNFNWFLDDVKVLSAATTFVFRTNYTSGGFHIVKVAVDDGELSTSRTWNVTVKNLNREPTKVAILTPRPGELVKEGAPVKFEGNATDPDDDALTYRWMEGLMELGKGRVFYTSLGIGMHKITLEVSDGNVTVKSPIVSISVKANSKPSIISFSPSDGKRFDKGKVVMFSAEAIDADNDVLSYCWTENGRVLSTTPTFSLPNLAMGRHRVTVTVSDGLATAENTVTIEVGEPRAGGLDTTMLLGIVAAVVVVAGLAAVVMMRRGRKPAAAQAPLKQIEVKW
jgi:hypothetical protein